MNNPQENKQLEKYQAIEAIEQLMERTLKSLQELQSFIKDRIFNSGFIYKPASISFDEKHKEASSQYLAQSILQGNISLVDLPLILRFNDSVYHAEFRARRNKVEGFTETLKTIMEDFEEIIEIEDPRYFVYGYSLPNVLHLLNREFEFCEHWGNKDFEKYMEENWESFIQKIYRRFGKCGGEMS